MESSSVEKDPGVSVEDRAKLFVVVYSGKMRGNKHMLKQERSSLNTVEIFLSPERVKHGEKLPREAV